MAGPPEPIQNRSVSTLLRDDSLGLAIKSELEASIPMVQAGTTMTKCTDFLFTTRELERYVAVCPHSARVYLMKPPTKFWAASSPEERPGPVLGIMDAATFGVEIAKLPAYKSDQLVGAIPATSKHVDKRHRERAFMLITETNEMTLLVEDAEARRNWLAACSAILGRSRDAMVLASVKAIEEKKATAQEQIAEAEALQEATAAAKQKAEEEGEAAKRRAQAEAAAAKAAAEAEAKAAKEHAEAELKEARRRDEEALQDGREQLHKAIKEHGGEKLQLTQARECCVCFEAFLGFDGGVTCSGSASSVRGPHFVCNACFVASVQSAITDDMAKQALRCGRVACPYATHPATENACDAACFPGKLVAEKVDEKPSVRQSSGWRWTGGWSWRSRRWRRRG